jgi:hypothetical protein
MALITSTVFFPSSNYSVDSIVFDLLLNESHSMESQISSHLVENGSEISDHIQNRLRRGSLTGMVGNFSLRAGAFFPGGLVDREKTTYEAFLDLWKKKIRVTIVTQLETYKDVVVTSVTTNRNSGQGSKQEFGVTFQQLTSVILKEVQLEARINIRDTKTDINKQASSKVNIGRTTAVPK